MNNGPHSMSWNTAFRRFLPLAMALGFAAAARANFEVKISPNQLVIGKPMEITITTQNLGLPEGATIDYSVMGISRPAGVPVTFESSTARATPPAYAPVKVKFTLPDDAPAGMAMLVVHGLVKDASGEEIGPKDSPVNVVVMQGDAPATAASGPCTASVEPAAIELTRDFKPKEVMVQASSNCTEAQIRTSFAMLGHGIMADLCNINVQKQGDGNYPPAKFVVRANPNADAPPEGLDWPIALLGTGNKHLGDDAKVNIKLAGAAPAAEPAQLPLKMPSGNRILKNREAGKCLTAQTGRVDGSSLVLADCGSSIDLQTFSFGPHGEIHNGNKCAVLSANATDDNTPIVLWTCNNGGQSNEMWTFDASSRIIGRDFKKCMEPNGSDPNHAAILRPCWDGNNQKWDAGDLPAAPTKLARSFPASSGMLKNGEYGTCLTTPQNISDGAQLVLAECGSNPAGQTFTFGSNGELQIASKCAVLNGNSTNDDTPVVLWTCSNSGNMNEIWTMDSGSRLIGREHQKCLEPNGSDAQNHSSILRPCWGGANQKWSVVAPPPPPPARLARSFPSASGLLKNRSTGNCLTAEGMNDGARLTQAPCTSNDTQLFSFGNHGEIQIGNKCAVLQSNQTDDNTPIILWTCSNVGNANEIWTMDSSNRLIGREHQKCIEPNGSDGAGSAIFRPCWDGDNQKWNVEQALVAAAPPPAVNRKRFSLIAAPQSLTIPVGKTVTYTLEAVSADIQEQMENREWLIVKPEPNGLVRNEYNDWKVKLNTRDPQTLRITGVQAGSEPLRITATSPTTGLSHTVEIALNVVDNAAPPPVIGGGGHIRRGGDRPGLERDAPDTDTGGGTGVADLEEMGELDFTPFTDDLRGLKASNLDLEGLGSALENNPIEYEDPEAAAQQIAVLKTYEALLGEASSGSMAGLKDGSSDQLAQLFEQSSGLYADPNYNRSSLKLASVGLLPIIEDVSFVLPEPVRTTRTGWAGLGKVENLIQQMRIARDSQRISDVAGFLGKIADKAQEVMEAKGIDNLPQAKGVAVAAGIISMVDVMAKAGIALMPSHVDRFYSVVKGYGRNPGDPKPVIALKEEARVNIYLVGKTEGGTIVTPWQVATVMAGRIMKLKKIQKYLEKIPDTKKAQWDLRKQLFAEIQKHVKKTWESVSTIPMVKAFGDKLAETWQVKPFRTAPVEVNSNLVLNWQTLSSECIQTSSKPTTPHDVSYFITGLKECPGEAGYFFGLTRDLIREFPEAKGSYSGFTKRGVVIVKGDKPRPDGGDKKAGTPCAWSASGAIEGFWGSDGKCYGSH